MRMAPIEGSSYIAEIGYDDATQKMRVRFSDGSMFEAIGVPADMHKAWVAASSKGKFWHAHIRPKYTFSRVTEE